MRGRRLHIPWRQSAQTLFQRYRREQDPQLRQRWQALWLLRDGRSLGQVATVIGVHYVTVQRWVAWYRQGGLEELRRHRRGGPGKPSYLSRQQQQRLRQEAQRGNFFSAQDVRAWVHEHFGVVYSRWGIYSLLRRVELRKKVPRPPAAKAALSAQRAWKKGACWQP